MGHTHTHTHTHTQIGVYLSLRGVVYANNSVVSITEIGETNPDTNLNEGLQCITDRVPCCRSAFRVGEWYFPNRAMVPGENNSPTTFYRNRGYDDGTVTLNRVNTNIMMPIGLFCCMVPDFDDIMQTVCATISELQLSCKVYVVSYLLPFQLHLFLSRLVMVELLQLQDRATPSPVVSLELVSPPTSGGKIALHCLKQDQLSPFLLSDCLMPDSTPVWSLWGDIC